MKRITKEHYNSARLTADPYRGEILSRLQRAYQLMTQQYCLTTASFIRVLTLQRMLYENETAYVDALEHVWTGSIAVRGFLLEDSLMSPASMGMQKPGTEPWESMGEGSETTSRHRTSFPSKRVFHRSACRAQRVEQS